MDDNEFDGGSKKGDDKMEEEPADSFVGPLPGRSIDLSGPVNDTESVTLTERQLRRSIMGHPSIAKLS